VYDCNENEHPEARWDPENTSVTRSGDDVTAHVTVSRWMGCRTRSEGTVRRHPFDSEP
jgi:hypothetical protein